MNPNLTTFLVLVGLILSLFAGEIFRLIMGAVVSRAPRGKCRGRCGDLGWRVARQDQESCHALCVKCRWMSHFDIKRWQELNKP
jgi:hypothetical protein